MDRRHLFKCQGKEIKGPRLVCSICKKLVCKKGFYMHMQRKHGIHGWKRKEHPEDKSEVSNTYSNDLKN